jgi:hypothetical protein
LRKRKKIKTEHVSVIKSNYTKNKEQTQIEKEETNKGKKARSLDIPLKHLLKSP